MLPDPLDLDQLRRVLQGMTPPPWAERQYNSFWGDSKVIDSRIIVSNGTPFACGVDVAAIPKMQMMGSDFDGIVALVNAAPALLDRIEALEKAGREMVEVYQQMRDHDHEEPTPLDIDCPVCRPLMRMRSALSASPKPGAQPSEDQ